MAAEINSNELPITLRNSNFPVCFGIPIFAIMALGLGAAAGGCISGLPSPFAMVMIAICGGLSAWCCWLCYITVKILLLPPTLSIDRSGIRFQNWRLVWTLRWVDMSSIGYSLYNGLLVYRTTEATAALRSKKARWFGCEVAAVPSNWIGCHGRDTARLIDECRQLSTRQPSILNI